MSFADLRSNSQQPAVSSSLTRPASATKFGFSSKGKKVDKENASAVAAAAGSGCGPRNISDLATSSPLTVPGNRRDLDRTFTGNRHQRQQTRELFLPPQLALEDRFSRAIGRRVCLSGEKFGALRYFGPLHVAEGLFCGIELDDELGQHDGYIDGRRYFRAQPRRGIFAPVEKVRVVGLGDEDEERFGIEQFSENSSMSSSDEKTIFDNTYVISNKSGRRSSTDANQILMPQQRSRTSSEELFTGGEELLTDIEPHLMSYSMLDEADPLSENDQKSGTHTEATVNAPQNQSGNLLTASFELSDSLLFLKQSRFPGFEVSMTGSQLEALMGGDEDEKHQLEKNYVSMKKSAIAMEKRPDDEKTSRRIDQTARKTSEGPLGTHFPIPINSNSSSADYDELPTPVCAEAADLFSESFVEFSEGRLADSTAKTAMLSSSTSLHTGGEDKQLFEPAVDRTYSNAPGPKLADASGRFSGSDRDDTFVLRQTSTKKNGKERPVSTISADTGYQGDTEYETHSGRSSSPPEAEDFEKKEDRVGRGLSSSLTGSSQVVERETASTETQTDLDSCQVNVLDARNRPSDVSVDQGGSEISYVEMVYRDKYGKVVKIVKGDQTAVVNSFAESNGLHATTPSEGPRGGSSKITSPKKDIAGKSSVAGTGKNASSPKHRLEKQESLNAQTKIDASNNALAKKGEINNNKDKGKDDMSARAKTVGVKEAAEPQFKKPRLPTKPSKHAEIMAKLQQSIAQDKNKPKKEIKSKYFSASEAAKNDEAGGSRSHSRAGSTAPSVQLSPVDGVPVDKGLSPVDSIATAASSETSYSVNDQQNGLNNNNKRASLTAADQSKVAGGKTLSSYSKRDISNVDNSKKANVDVLAANKRLSNAKPNTNMSSRQKASVPSNRPTTGRVPATKPQSGLVDKSQKLLPLSSMNQRLSQTARGFEAACIVVQHFTQYVIPRLEQKFTAAKDDLVNSRSIIHKLDNEKSSLSSDIDAQKAMHDTAFANIRKEHEEALARLEKKLNREHENKAYDVKDQHEQEIRKIMDDYVVKEQFLTKNAEDLREEEMQQCQQKIANLIEQHDKESQEMKQNFAKENEDLKQQFELWKASMEEKLKESKNACDRYKNEARVLEASLMKDAEKKMQDVNERFALYKQEIDSLHAVLDLKNTEIHELRVKCQVLEKDLERYPLLKTKVAVLEQKNVELREALELKKVAERRLSQKHLELQQTCERERDRAQRLSMTNEQLQYRLQHVMMSQSAYETPMSRFPSGDSPDCSSDFSFRDKPMSQSLIHIYANNSPRSSQHHVPVTVYTNDGVSKALCFEKSGTDSAQSKKRRSISERSNVGVAGGNIDVSPYVQTLSSSMVQGAKNIDKRSSSAPGGAKRRISPLGGHHYNASGGVGTVGLPGVETVAEVCETHHQHHQNCGGGSSESETTDPSIEFNTATGCCAVSSGGPQKTTSGGYLADSGVFTSSFHCDTIDRPLSQTSSTVFAPHELNASSSDEFNRHHQLPDVSTPKGPSSSSPAFSDAKTPQ